MPAVGCPIRIPLDHPVPARPQGFSQRGRVLHRQSAPRHPPCAHLRGFPRLIHVSAHPCLATGVHELNPAPARDHSPTNRRSSPSSTYPPVRKPDDMRFPLPEPVTGLPCCSGCGAAGTRTPDLRRARAALSQLSYGPLPPSRHSPARFRSVGAPGLEPGTSVLSGPRSNHLSYAPLSTRSSLRRRRSEHPIEPTPCSHTKPFWRASSSYPKVSLAPPATRRHSVWSSPALDHL